MQEKLGSIKGFLKEYRCYATIALVIINVAWFLYVSLVGGLDTQEELLKYGAMTSDSLQNGEYLPLFTAMFLHFDLQHVGNNMLMLFALGSMLEQYTGSVCFLILYLVSGIGGNIVSAVMHVKTSNIVISAGASGAVFGIVGAFLGVLIMNKGRIRDMTAKKMVVFAALSLYQGITSQGIDNYAHFGGFCVGLAAAVILELIRKAIGQHNNGEAGNKV